MIKIKRVYDEAEENDGLRSLVDRVWPRGLKKTDLAMDEWLKDVAPSNRLRKWLGHDPKRSKEFRRRYFAELRAKPEQWMPRLQKARKSDVTLLYAARSEDNSAGALKEFLTARLEDQPGSV